MASSAFAGVGWNSRHLRDLALIVASAALVLGVLTRRSVNLPFLIIALLAGFAIIRWTLLHRSTALALVFLVLPLQQTVLSWLYANGAPFALVRYAGFYKEAVIAGLVLAVLIDPAARRVRLGLADWAGLLYIVVATFYLLLPAAIPGALGGQPTEVRFSAWRLNVMFVVLFLACRRLEWTTAEVRKLENALLTVGAVLAAGGLWQIADESSYDNFLTNVIEQPRFVVEVLSAAVTQTESVLVFGTSGDGEYTRVGSWIINPLTLGFVMIIPIAIGMRRLSTGGRTAPVLLATAGCVVVLQSTLTRSAILGGLVATAVVLWLAVRGNQKQAVTLVIGLIVAAACVVPFLPGTSLADRITGAADGTDESAQTHSERTSDAFDLALRTPLGLGLGANPGTGVNFDTDNFETAENAYLQVSIELGWAAAVLFVLLNAALIRDAFARDRRRPGAGGAAVAGAACGLAVGAFFLHVWIDFQTALLFWGFAGVVTSRLGAPEALLEEGSAETEPIQVDDMIYR